MREHGQMRSGPESRIQRPSRGAVPPYMSTWSNSRAADAGRPPNGIGKRRGYKKGSGSFCLPEPFHISSIKGQYATPQ